MYEENVNIFALNRVTTYITPLKTRPINQFYFQILQ